MINQVFKHLEKCNSCVVLVLSDFGKETIKRKRVARAIGLTLLVAFKWGFACKLRGPCAWLRLAVPRGDCDWEVTRHLK